MKPDFTRWPAPVLIAMALGCGNGTGPDAALTLSLIGTPPGTNVTLSEAASGFVYAQAPLTDGQGNQLEITRAQVVFREIELERVGTEGCEAASVDNDDCEEFEVGPVLFDIPLNGQTQQVIGITAPAGSYDEIEFEIHKPSDSDQADAAFRAAHPDFVGVSIRVQGSFNGDAFTYESDLNVEQEFDLTPALVIGDGTVSTNVTVLLDVTVWFRDATGNLIDPATANKGGANEGIVKENIKQSTEAFEDDDRDGDDDGN